MAEKNSAVERLEAAIAAPLDGESIRQTFLRPIEETRAQIDEIAELLPSSLHQAGIELFGEFIAAAKARMNVLDVGGFNIVCSEFVEKFRRLGN